MTPHDLEALTARVQDWTGIDMRRGGLVPALKRYIDMRARALRVTAHELIRRVDSTHADETRALLDALTVGHTWFFRDAAQLQSLSGLLKRDRTNHIWIPACASGEEPYTVAMIAKECGAEVRILATDINSEFLRQAQLAEYSDWAVREVPSKLRSHLRHENGISTVSVEMKRVVRFERQNVRDRAPDGVWDIILCRNMLIYFAHRHATETVARLADALASDGALIVGAADLCFDCPPTLYPQSVEGRWLLKKGAPAVPVAVARRISSPPVAPPLHIEKRVSLADALMDAHRRIHAGDLRGAEPVCTRIVSEEPMNAEGHFLLGVLQLQSQRPKDALQSLRAALLLAPHFWPAAHYLERLAPKEEAHAATLLVASADSIAGSGRPLLEQLESLRFDLIRRAERRLFGEF